MDSKELTKKSSNDSLKDSSDKPKANPQGEQVSLADIFNQMMEMRGEIKEVKEENRLIKEENRQIKYELQELRVENQQLRQTIADKDQQLQDKDQQNEQLQKQAEESKEKELLSLAETNFVRADKYFGEAQRSQSGVRHLREELKKAQDLTVQSLKDAQLYSSVIGVNSAYKLVRETFQDFMQNGLTAENHSNAGEGNSTDGRPMSVHDDLQAFAGGLAMRLSTYCVNKLSPENKKAFPQEKLISHFQTAITSNQVYNEYCAPVEEGLEQVEDQINRLAGINQTCVKLQGVAKDVLNYISEREPQIDEQLLTIAPTSALASILQKEKQTLTEAKPLYQQAEKDWHDLQGEIVRGALNEWKKSRVQWRMTRGEAIPEDDSDYYSDLDQPETVKRQIENNLRNLKFQYMQDKKKSIDDLSELRKNTPQDQWPNLAEDEKKKKEKRKQQYEEAKAEIHTRYEQRLEKSILRSIEKTESQLLAAAHGAQGTNLKRIGVHFQGKQYDLPLVEEQSGGVDHYWDPKRAGVCLCTHLVWSKHSVLLVKRDDGQYTLPPPDKQLSPSGLAQKDWEDLDGWRIGTVLAETTPPSSHEGRDLGTIRHVLGRLGKQEKIPAFKQLITQLEKRKAGEEEELRDLQYIFSAKDDFDNLLGSNSPEFDPRMYSDGSKSIPRGIDVSELFHTYQFAYIGVGKDGQYVGPIPVDNVAKYHERVEDKDWYVVGLLRKEPGSAQQTSSSDKSLSKRISSESGESAYQSLPGGKSFYSVSDGSSPIPPQSPSSEDGFHTLSEDDASSEPSVPSTNSSLLSLEGLRKSLFDWTEPGIVETAKKHLYFWNPPVVTDATLKEDIEKLNIKYNKKLQTIWGDYKLQLEAYEHEEEKAMAVLEKKYQKTSTISQPGEDVTDPVQTEEATTDDEAYHAEKQEIEAHWQQKKSDLAKEKNQKEEKLSMQYDKALRRLYASKQSIAKSPEQTTSNSAVFPFLSQVEVETVRQACQGEALNAKLAEDAYNTGMKHRKKGQLEQARNLFSDATANDLGNASYHQA